MEKAIEPLKRTEKVRVRYKLYKDDSCFNAFNLPKNEYSISELEEYIKKDHPKLKDSKLELSQVTGDASTGYEIIVSVVREQKNMREAQKVFLQRNQSMNFKDLSVFWAFRNIAYRFMEFLSEKDPKNFSMDNKHLKNLLSYKKIPENISSFFPEKTVDIAVFFSHPINSENKQTPYESLCTAVLESSRGRDVAVVPATIQNFRTVKGTIAVILSLMSNEQLEIEDELHTSEWLSREHIPNLSPLFLQTSLIVSVTSLPIQNNLFYRMIEEDKNTSFNLLVVDSKDFKKAEENLKMAIRTLSISDQRTNPVILHNSDSFKWKLKGETAHQKHEQSESLSKLFRTKIDEKKPHDAQELIGFRETIPEELLCRSRDLLGMIKLLLDDSNEILVLQGPEGSGKSFFVKGLQNYLMQRRCFGNIHYFLVANKGKEIYKRDIERVYEKIEGFRQSGKQLLAFQKTLFILDNFNYHPKFSENFLQEILDRLEDFAKKQNAQFLIVKNDIKDEESAKEIRPSRTTKGPAVELRPLGFHSSTLDSQIITSPPKSTQMIGLTLHVSSPNQEHERSAIEKAEERFQRVFSIKKRFLLRPLQSRKLAKVFINAISGFAELNPTQKDQIESFFSDINDFWTVSNVIKAAQILKTNAKIRKTENFPKGIEITEFLSSLRGQDLDQTAIEAVQNDKGVCRAFAFLSFFNTVPIPDFLWDKYTTWDDLPEKKNENQILSSKESLSSHSSELAQKGPLPSSKELSRLFAQQIKVTTEHYSFCGLLSRFNFDSILKKPSNAIYFSEGVVDFLKFMHFLALFVIRVKTSTAYSQPNQRCYQSDKNLVEASCLECIDFWQDYNRVGKNSQNIRHSSGIFDSEEFYSRSQTIISFFRDVVTSFRFISVVRHVLNPSKEEKKEKEEPIALTPSAKWIKRSLVLNVTALRAIGLSKEMKKLFFINMISSYMDIIKKFSDFKGVFRRLSLLFVSFGKKDSMSDAENSMENSQVAASQITNAKGGGFGQSMLYSQINLNENPVSQSQLSFSLTEEFKKSPEEVLFCYYEVLLRLEKKQPTDKIKMSSITRERKSQKWPDMVKEIDNIIDPIQKLLDDQTVPSKLSDKTNEKPSGVSQSSLAGFGLSLSNQSTGGLAFQRKNEKRKSLFFRTGSLDPDLQILEEKESDAVDEFVHSSHQSLQKENEGTSLPVNEETQHLEGSESDSRLELVSKSKISQDSFPCTSPKSNLGSSQLIHPIHLPANLLEQPQGPFNTSQVQMKSKSHLSGKSRNSSNTDNIATPRNDLSLNRDLNFKRLGEQHNDLHGEANEEDSKTESQENAEKTRGLRMIVNKLKYKKAIINTFLLRCSCLTSSETAKKEKETIKCVNQVQSYFRSLRENREFEKSTEVYEFYEKKLRYLRLNLELISILRKINADDENTETDSLKFEEGIIGLVWQMQELKEDILNRFPKESKFLEEHLTPLLSKSKQLLNLFRERVVTVLTNIYQEEFYERLIDILGQSANMEKPEQKKEKDLIVSDYYLRIERSDVQLINKYMEDQYGSKFLVLILDSLAGIVPQKTTNIKIIFAYIREGKNHSNASNIEQLKNFKSSLFFTEPMVNAKNNMVVHFNQFVVEFISEFLKERVNKRMDTHEKILEAAEDVGKKLAGPEFDGLFRSTRYFDKITQKDPIKLEALSKRSGTVKNEKESGFLELRKANSVTYGVL